MNEQEINQYVELRNRIEEEAHRLWRRYSQIWKEITGKDHPSEASCYLEYTGIDMDEGVINFKGDEFYSGYDLHEYHYASLPISWLYDDTWEPKAREEALKAATQTQREAEWERQRRISEARATLKRLTGSEE